MKMPKVIFALLLLLVSCNIFAFSPASFPIAETIQDNGSPALTESVVDVYESTLIISITLPKKSHTADPVLHSFIISSALKSNSAHRYVKFSQYIDPGLDVPEIIFPFHIFL